MSTPPSTAAAAAAAAAGSSEGPTLQPSEHVFAPYLPRAVTGRSSRFVEHDDAVVAAVDALNVDQLLLLLNQAGTIPFWRCMRSLCHAYPTPNPLRWEQMAALVLHAHIGTWRAGQPPPMERPQLNTSSNVQHLDNPLSTGVNEALLDDACWDVKAFQVLLSLGVPFVDFLVWDELLERAGTLKEHLRAIADHFGRRLFSQEDILQRLEVPLQKIATCDPAEDLTHEMEATKFLMRIFFRWFLEEISVEAWEHELQPLWEALDIDESPMGSACSSSTLGPVTSALSLENLLKQTFLSLAEEEGSIVHLWCPKHELPCRDLLCPYAHSRKQLLLRNPLLRFSCPADCHLSCQDELRNAIWKLMAQPQAQRHTCHYALNNIFLLLQSYRLDSNISGKQLRDLTRVVVQALAPMARAYYSAELHSRVLQPLLWHLFNTSKTAAGATSLQQAAEQYISHAAAQSTPVQLGAPLRVLTGILSLLQHRHVEEAAREVGMLIPNIARVDVIISKAITVPATLLPLFINFQSRGPRVGQPTLLGSTAGHFQLWQDRYAPTPMLVEFTHLEHVFSDAADLVRAMKNAGAGSIKLNGREAHSDYLGPPLVWFTPRINDDKHNHTSAPSLSTRASRFGPYRLTVPIALVFDGAHMRCLKLGTRQLEHRRLISGEPSVEWAHCMLLTQRPAFAVGDPFGADSQPSWTPSSCAIPEFSVLLNDPVPLRDGAALDETPLLTYDKSRRRAMWRVSRGTQRAWDELKFAVPEPHVLFRAKDGARIDFLDHITQQDDLCHGHTTDPLTPRTSGLCAHKHTKEAAAEAFMRECADQQLDLGQWMDLLDFSATNMSGIKVEIARSKKFAAAAPASASSSSGAPKKKKKKFSSAIQLPTPVPPYDNMPLANHLAMVAELQERMWFELDTVRARYLSLLDSSDPLQTMRLPPQGQMSFHCKSTLHVQPMVGDTPRSPVSA